MPREIVVPIGNAQATVRPGDHIAYFWESPAEFERGVAFLSDGLKSGDFGVIFGHDDANARVCTILDTAGCPSREYIRSGQLLVLGPETTGDATLQKIEKVFQEAVDRGVPLIRLLGNIGWGKPGWPHEDDILAFEAKVTGAARQFPCVVVCMYDVRALPGTVILHGAFETHPVTVCGNIVRENKHYVDVDDFLARFPKPPEAT